jgi:inward rectifier potassium channel
MSKDRPMTASLVTPRLAGEGEVEAVIRGQSKGGWRDAYHYLLTMPLGALVGLLAGVYVGVNAVFALIYVMVGGVSGLAPGDFAAAFFFSVETMSTVGYGEMSPSGFWAHVVVSAETFVGLFNLAITTGLLFARFSRPTARVMFSSRAVVTNFNGHPTLIFRAANRRRNRILEAEVSLTLVRDVTTLEGDTMRRFEPMTTLRSRTPIFNLTWQVMHRIDETSPINAEGADDLRSKRAEIVVVLSGIDETFSQTIHARTSYTADEVLWGRRFADIFVRDNNGRQVIDFSHFDDIV